MKKKKQKNKNKLATMAFAPAYSSADLNTVLALEKAVKAQVKELEEALAASPQPRPVPKKGDTPFPASLGRHLLQRLLTLEAAAGRLAEQAESRGDMKTALKAIQVSTRLINATIRLAARHPHLADDWQPEATVNHLVAVAPEVPSAATPEGRLAAPQGILSDLASPPPRLDHTAAT